MVLLSVEVDQSWGVTEMCINSMIASVDEVVFANHFSSLGFVRISTDGKHCSVDKNSRGHFVKLLRPFIGDIKEAEQKTVEHLLY